MGIRAARSARHKIRKLLDSSELSSFEQVEQVVPEIVAETAENESVEIDEAGVIDIEGDFIDEDAEASGVSFSIDYVSGKLSQENGLALHEGLDEGIEAIAQPTPVGARVMTVISEEAETDQFQYTFDVPEGTELVENEAGYSLESEDDLLGTIQVRWAVDAAGGSGAYFL